MTAFTKSPCESSNRAQSGRSSQDWRASEWTQLLRVKVEERAGCEEPRFETICLARRFTERLRTRRGSRSTAFVSKRYETVRRAAVL